jgi:sec-independent protein translocase protein TatA
MGFGLEPWHIILVVVAFVVLFGAKRLPEMGKGLGEGWKGFKEGLSGQPDANTKTGETAHTVTPAAKPADEVKPPPAA